MIIKARKLNLQVNNGAVNSDGRMSEWMECKLGELVCKIIDNRGKNPPYTANGYEVIETSCVSGNNKHPNYNLVKKFVSDDCFDNWFRAGHPEKDDLLIITVGNGIGNISIMKETRGAITQNLVGLKVNKEKADPNFLYYYLAMNNIQEYLSGLDIGSAQPSLKVSHLLNTVVPSPPLPEQRAIASVLSSLDDKIDLLHRQNKTLEAMAETLFRQWFVELEGDAIPVTDLVDFNPTRNLKKGTSAPYLEMANINTSTFHPKGWYARDFSSGMRFVNGDTLLARITPCLENGKAAYVNFLNEGEVGWGSTEFIVMRSKGNLHPLFTYALAKNRSFRDYAEGCLVGSSGRQRVEINHLFNFDIVIPQKEIIKEFNSVMESIEPKLHSNFMQIRILERMRDTLLPKLISGEVQVTI
jgi:type I restriction enzyme, S subunit